MCRNIRTLFNFEPPASDDEVHAAALQFVRKVSGSSKPSLANVAAFERAVTEITGSTRRLLNSLQTTAAPRDREIEAERPEPEHASGLFDGTGNGAGLSLLMRTDVTLHSSDSAVDIRKGAPQIEERIAGKMT